MYVGIYYIPSIEIYTTHDERRRKPPLVVSFLLRQTCNRKTGCDCIDDTGY